MKTGELINSLLVALVAGAVFGYCTRGIGAEGSRVSIRVLADAVECHVPIDPANRWLDIVLEDVTGSGHDLAEQEQSTYRLQLPQPLYCPYQADVISAFCELDWFDAHAGKMRTVRSDTHLACQP